MSDHEDPQFKNWLTARMSAANLTQAERTEFMQWLLKRKDANSTGSDSSSKSNPAKKKERLKELKECFDWLKVRITDSDLTDCERQEFDSWMASKARDANLFDDNE